MAKIPWFLWVIVGAAMFLISYRIGGKMQIFLYIGLVCLIIGIFKMLVAFILGGRGRKAEKEAREIRTHEFTCQRCRAVVASTYNFCPHCGTRMRY